MNPARLIFSILLLSALAHAEPLRIPAASSYADPDANARLRRNKDGSVEKWAGGETSLLWFGRINQPGDLKISLETAAAPAAAKLQLTVTPQAGGPSATLDGKGEPGAPVTFGTVPVAKPGYYKFALKSQDSPAPGLTALILDGPAAAGAHFSTVERKNAASVHLAYPVPAEAKDKVEWFYCELTPKADPVATYYEACGWHRGYFGMQVNSPTERRIIFSVWDSGNEGVDRSKVAANDRVTLLAKGDGVDAGDFGNEGTGGHSHLVYPWKTGDTFKFLLHATTDTDGGPHTTCSGWFWFEEKKAWGLIARFRAPKDGKLPSGLYSFNENFGGGNGHLARHCLFGNQWVRTTGGKWVPLLEAHFTHDGHGKAQRLDRSAGLEDGRFYLTNGGFQDDTNPTAVTKYGAPLTRPAGDSKPPLDDAALPKEKP